jgi:transcriptional regulator with PAS, ATPase and Fis domain
LFREDLFYRLNVLKLRIPPLRDRITDIPALTDYFSLKYCLELDRSYHRISPTTISGFCDYKWPGNLKELEKKVAQIIMSGREKQVLQSLIETKSRGDQKKRGAPKTLLTVMTGMLLLDHICKRPIHIH